jgi:hypothetical protein
MDFIDLFGHLALFCKKSRQKRSIDLLLVLNPIRKNSPLKLFFIKIPKTYSILYDFVLELDHTIGTQISNVIFCVPLCTAIGIL